MLIDEGIDAVAISSAGERPLARRTTTARRPRRRDAGRVRQRRAGDRPRPRRRATAPPEHGPATYVRFCGNLIPGWALALLALALLLPAAVAAFDGIARARAPARRRDRRPCAGPRSLPLPLLAGLAALYLLWRLPASSPTPPIRSTPGASASTPPRRWRWSSSRPSSRPATWRPGLAAAAARRGRSWRRRSGALAIAAVRLLWLAEPVPGAARGPDRPRLARRRARGRPRAASSRLRRCSDRAAGGSRSASSRAPSTSAPRHRGSLLLMVAGGQIGPRYGVLPLPLPGRARGRSPAAHARALAADGMTPGPRGDTPPHRGRL